MDFIRREVELMEGFGAKSHCQLGPQIVDKMHTFQFAMLQISYHTSFSKW